MPRKSALQKLTEKLVSTRRIYVIVADTVQNPVTHDYQKIPQGNGYWKSHYILKRTPETKTIVQPAGRIAAQCAHVVSRMRQDILLEAGKHYVCAKPVKGKPWPELQAAYDEAKVLASLAITTIILAVPNSFQLEFYDKLLQRFGVKVHRFFDTNEEYGWGNVKTAICTEPIEKYEGFGILDYLPLWKPTPAQMAPYMKAMEILRSDLGSMNWFADKES